jgi:tripartite-type tricarboxylate transporter receptor subunit TctC
MARDRMMRSIIRAAAVVLCLSMPRGGAWAQDYPSHPIKLVVPFAAGGPSDVAGRTLADALSRQLKQTIIIEDIGGAGGNVGAARVAQASPDGYTLMFTNISMAISPSLYSDLAYDPVRDFVGIGIAVFSPTMLVARHDFATVPFDQFLDYLRSNGEKIAAATTGPGGPSDLCASLLMKQLKTRFNLIPYKGTGPAMTDVVAGRVDFVCDAVITAAPHAKAGSVRAYGIVGTSRTEIMPELPTLAEQGLPDVAMRVWSGLYAPKATPQPVIDRLAAALKAALSDPDFQRKAEAVGQEIVPPELATPAARQPFCARRSSAGRRRSRGASRPIEGGPFARPVALIFR